MENEGSEKSENPVTSSKLLMISLTILTIVNFVALAVISVFVHSTYEDIKRNSTSIALTKIHIHKLDSDISKLSLKLDESLKTPPTEQESEKPQPDKIEAPTPEKKEEDDDDLQLEDEDFGFKDKTPEKHNYPEGYGVKRLKTKEEIDQKLLLALYWLRDHQDPKLGSWSSDNFEEQCKTTDTLFFSPKFKRNGVCLSLIHI